MKNQLISFRKGDLSAPVLAIIVTIGIIAAGLLLMAWFWWFAPQAGKTGSLQILGTPVLYINVTTNNGEGLKGNITISLRNTGNDPIKVEANGVIVRGVACIISETTLNPGESKVITAGCDFTNTNNEIPARTRTVEAIIKTDYGVFPVTLTVIWP